MGAKRSDIDLEGNVKLSELISALRKDLLESQIGDQKPVFRINGATVEVEAVVSKEISAGGKVNVYLTSLGADTKQASGARCKMTISLEPLGDGDVYLRGAESE